MKFKLLVIFYVGILLSGCATQEGATPSASDSPSTPLPAKTVETNSGVAMGNVTVVPATGVPPIAKADIGAPSHESVMSPAANVFLPIEPQFKPAEPIAVAKVDFRLGEASATIEKMAKEQGCESRLGAGLLGISGPLERYRISCVDGRELEAQCEFRQCVFLSKH